MKKNAERAARAYSEMCALMLATVGVFGFIAPPLISANDDLLCFAGVLTLFVAPFALGLWAFRIFKQLRGFTR